MEHENRIEFQIVDALTGQCRGKAVNLVDARIMYRAFSAFHSDPDRFFIHHPTLPPVDMISVAEQMKAQKEKRERGEVEDEPWLRGDIFRDINGDERLFEILCDKIKNNPEAVQRIIEEEERTGEPMGMTIYLNKN